MLEANIKKYANKTVSGRNIDPSDPYNFFIQSQQLNIWRTLYLLGYCESSIKGMARSVVKIYKCLRLRYLDESDVIEIISILDIDNHFLNDRNQKERKEDALTLKLVLALFCYDRAISRAAKRKNDESTIWLESALKLDFFLPNESRASSERAKRSASKRHFKTRALKSEIKSFWHEFIDPDLPNTKAADRLLKEFALEWTTLRDYVAEFKKE